MSPVPIMSPVSISCYPFLSCHPSLPYYPSLPCHPSLSYHPSIPCHPSLSYHPSIHVTRPSAQLKYTLQIPAVTLHQHTSFSQCNIVLSLDCHFPSLSVDVVMCRHQQLSQHPPPTNMHKNCAGVGVSSVIISLSFTHNYII